MGSAVSNNLRSAQNTPLSTTPSENSFCLASLDTTVHLEKTAPSDTECVILCHSMSESSSLRRSDAPRAWTTFSKATRLNLSQNREEIPKLLVSDSEARRETLLKAFVRLPNRFRIAE